MGHRGAYARRKRVMPRVCLRKLDKAIPRTRAGMARVGASLRRPNVGSLSPATCHWPKMGILHVVA